MARPRKDESNPAEQRIKDAFWTLLEEKDLKDITVSMITHEARCNRGSFYYHFNSLDELIQTLAEEELVLRNGVPRALFYLICKKTNPFEHQEFIIHVKRFALMMQRAGQEGIDTKVKSNVVAIWENMLSEYSKPLAFETRLVIEYSVSGLIGLISYLFREGLLEHENIPHESLQSFKDNSHYLVISLSRAQNISPQELEQCVCRQLRDPQSSTCASCNMMRTERPA